MCISKTIKISNGINHITFDRLLIDIVDGIYPEGNIFYGEEINDVDHVDTFKDLMLFCIFLFICNIVEGDGWFENNKEKNTTQMNNRSRKIQDRN